MSDYESIRVLFSRNHGTIYPGLGVFLAGPTPPDGAMENGWRRIVIQKLKSDERLDPTMAVVAPEPETGRWADINVETGKPKYDDVMNKQIPWEWQYLNLCDITVFWLPTYWSEERGGILGANIGPTTRWEFGYYFQEYLKNPNKKTFIVGAPEDAESVKWAKRLMQSHHIKWHTLKAEEKAEKVPETLIEAIAQALLRNKPTE
jgi:hypothetical protein